MRAEIADTEPERPGAKDEGAAFGQVLRMVAVLAFSAGALITVASLLNHFAFDDSVRDFDAGQETSFNNWLTVVASFAAGLGALLLALVTPDRRRMLITVAVIFAVISLDDMITLHERVGDNIGIQHIETAIFAPLYAFALFLTWRLADYFEPRIGRLLRTALILLAAAIVIDLGSTVTTDLAKEGTGWPQPTRIAFEEGFEVAGWVLLGGVLLAAWLRPMLASRMTEQRASEGPEADRWWRIVALAALVAGAGIALGAIFNHFALDDRIPDLNVELEASLNNWITVLGSFVAALGAALCSLLMPDRRRAFLALAAAFVFLSLDDQIRIHERLGDELDSVFVETLIFAPIYAATFLLAWTLAPSIGRRAALWLRTGIVLLGCAVAIDLGTSYTHDLEDEGITWPQPTRVAFEEGFEVAGWILIVGALIALPLGQRAGGSNLPGDAAALRKAPG